MSSLLIAAIFLSQVAAAPGQDALEQIKLALHNYRICSLDAARRRAMASNDLPQAVVEGAMADCDAAYNSLRASVSIPGIDRDANIPEPWLIKESEAWFSRLIDRIPIVRKNQRDCASRLTETRCKRLLAP